MKDKINELAAANREPERSGSESLNGTTFFPFAVTAFVKFSSKSLSLSTQKTNVCSRTLESRPQPDGPDKSELNGGNYVGIHVRFGQLLVKM